MSYESVGKEFDFDDVSLLAKHQHYQGFFQLNSYHIQHQLYAGGVSGEIRRELFQLGDAVAVLPYDPVRDCVVLVQQFRIGAYMAGCADRQAGQQPASPWLIECIAGMIDTNRTATAVAHSEAIEEAGIEIQQLTPIMRYFSTPGSCSERVHLFAATCDASLAYGVHGLDCENEDIKVLSLPLTTALDLLQQGRISSASTVIALQWLQLHKQQWLQQLTAENT